MGRKRGKSLLAGRLGDGDRAAGRCRPMCGLSLQSAPDRVVAAMAWHNDMVRNKTKARTHAMRLSPVLKLIATRPVPDFTVHRRAMHELWLDSKDAAFSHADITSPKISTDVAFLTPAVADCQRTLIA